MPIASWREQSAFEAWAKENRYEMHQHPLHYLFMDKQTDAARQGWKAALQFNREIQQSSPEMSSKEADLPVLSEASLPTTSRLSQLEARTSCAASVNDELTSTGQPDQNLQRELTTAIASSPFIEPLISFIADIRTRKRASPEDGGLLAFLEDLLLLLGRKIGTIGHTVRYRTIANASLREGDTPAPQSNVAQDAGMISPQLGRATAEALRPPVDDRFLYSLKAASDDAEETHHDAEEEAGWRKPSPISHKAKGMLEDYPDHSQKDGEVSDQTDPVSEHRSPARVFPHGLDMRLRRYGCKSLEAPLQAPPPSTNADGTP